MDIKKQQAKIKEMQEQLKVAQDESAARFGKAVLKELKLNYDAIDSVKKAKSLAKKIAENSSRSEDSVK